MPKQRAPDATRTKSKTRAGSTPEARENQLIALAFDAAEEQLRNGTASSQVISTLIKYGSRREKMEREMLEKKVALMEAQIESLESSQKSEELFQEALAAFRGYQGNMEDQSDGDD